MWRINQHKTHSHRMPNVQNIRERSNLLASLPEALSLHHSHLLTTTIKFIFAVKIQNMI